MIRLTWLQFRFQALAAGMALATLAVVLVITGRELGHLYTTAVVPCVAQGGDCASAYSLLRRQQQLLQNLLGPLLLIVPALIGIFWGAPLVARELETGTYQLAWTQSVSRNRWLAGKLGLLGLASMAAAGLLSLGVTWWFRPLDLVHANRFAPGTFDARDLVPLGYALFAFTLAVSAGLLLRRTLPAMAVTLAAFLGARLATIYWVRPHFMTAAHTSLPLRSGTNLGFSPSAVGVTFEAGLPAIPNAWTLSSQIVDQSGHVATPQVISQFLVTACPTIANPPAASPGAGHAPANQQVFQDCVAQLSSQYHLAVTYQPASRFWAFQWSELAFFVALSLLLAGGCFWWLRRHLA